MSEHTDPPSQPVAALALIAQQVAGLLATSSAQYDRLQQARANPGTLEAYALGRVLANFTVQRDGLWRFDAVLQRGAAAPSGAEQQVALDQLRTDVLRLYELTEAVLSLAATLQRQAGAG